MNRNSFLIPRSHSSWNYRCIEHAWHCLLTVLLTLHMLKLTRLCCIPTVYRFTLEKHNNQQNLLHLHLCRLHSLTCNCTHSTVSVTETYLHKFLSCSQSLQPNPFLVCFSDTYPETLSTSMSDTHPDTETHALVIRAESASRGISQWLSAGSGSIQHGFHTVTCPQTFHAHSGSFYSLCLLWTISL